MGQKRRDISEDIDRIDGELLRLLNARARCAQKVGEIKAVDQAPVYRPEREAQVIARLTRLNPGPLGTDAIATIWGEGHTMAESTGDSTTNFIEWVNKCLK